MQQGVSGELLAVPLADDEARQHIDVGVAKMRAAVIDQHPEIREHLGHRTIALLGAFRRQHRLERAQDVQRPAAQWLSLVKRNAQQVADDADRNRRREGLDQVDLAAGVHRVQQSVDERAEARFHCGNVPLADCAHDGPPHARMHRRIVEDQARRVMLEERRRAEFCAELLFLVRAEAFEVTIYARDVLVSREKPGAVGHVPDRLVVAECAIIRVRVGVEIRRKPGQVEARRERSRIVGSTGVGYRHRSSLLQGAVAKSRTRLART